MQFKDDPRLWHVRYVAAGTFPPESRAQQLTVMTPDRSVQDMMADERTFQEILAWPVGARPPNGITSRRIYDAKRTAVGDWKDDEVEKFFRDYDGKDASGAPTASIAADGSEPQALVAAGGSSGGAAHSGPTRRRLTGKQAAPALVSPAPPPAGPPVQHGGAGSQPAARTMPGGQPSPPWYVLFPSAGERVGDEVTLPAGCVTSGGFALAPRPNSPFPSVYAQLPEQNAGDLRNQVWRHLLYEFQAEFDEEVSKMTPRPGEGKGNQKGDT